MSSLRVSSCIPSLQIPLIKGSHEPVASSTTSGSAALIIKMNNFDFIVISGPVTPGQIRGLANQGREKRHEKPPSVLDAISKDLLDSPNLPKNSDLSRLLSTLFDEHDLPVGPERPKILDVLADVLKRKLKAEAFADNKRLWMFIFLSYTAVVEKELKNKKNKTIRLWNEAEEGKKRMKRQVRNGSCNIIDHAKLLHEVNNDVDRRNKIIDGCWKEIRDLNKDLENLDQTINEALGSKTPRGKDYLRSLRKGALVLHEFIASLINDKWPPSLVVRSVINREYVC